MPRCSAKITGRHRYESARKACLVCGSGKDALPSLARATASPIQAEPPATPSEVLLGRLREKEFSKPRVDADIEVSSEYQTGDSWVTEVSAPFVGDTTMHLQVCSGLCQEEVAAVVFFTINDADGNVLCDVESPGMTDMGMFEVWTSDSPEEFLEGLDVESALRDYVFPEDSDVTAAFDEAVGWVVASRLGIDTDNSAAIDALRQCDWLSLTPESPEVRMILATHRNP